MLNFPAQDKTGEKGTLDGADFNSGTMEKIVRLIYTYEVGRQNPAVLRVRKPFRAGEARNKEKVQIQGLEPLE